MRVAADVEPGRRVRCGWPCDVGPGGARAGRVAGPARPGPARPGSSRCTVGPAGRRAVRHRRLGCAVAGRSARHCREPGASVRDAGRSAAHPGIGRSRPGAVAGPARAGGRCSAGGGAPLRGSVPGRPPLPGARARREDLPGPARRRTRAVRGSRTDRSRPSRWSGARRPPGTVAGPPPAARGSGTPLRSAARTPADPGPFCAGRRPGRAAGRPRPSATSRHAEWSVVPVLRAIPEALRRRAGAGAGQVARAVRIRPPEGDPGRPANRAGPGTRPTIRRVVAAAGQGGAGPGTDRRPRHLLRPSQEQGGDGSSRPPGLRSLRSAVVGACSGIPIAVTHLVGSSQPPSGVCRSRKVCVSTEGV